MSVETYIPPETARHISQTARIYRTAVITPSVDLLTMGEKSFIGDYVFVSTLRLILSKGAQINEGSRLVGRNIITIGDYATVSYGCSLITTSDTSEGVYMCDAIEDKPPQRIFRDGPISIGPRCFIGSHSVIMPNVEIAAGSVVRAFSYVNESLARSDCIYGGQPARFIKERRYRYR